MPATRPAHIVRKLKSGARVVEVRIVKVVVVDVGYRIDPEDRRIVDTSRGDALNTEPLDQVASDDIQVVLITVVCHPCAKFIDQS